MSSDAAATAVMDAFLEAYVADLRAGRAQSLDHYQRKFPGHESAVEAAWRECHDDAETEAPEVAFEAIGAYEVLREIGRGGQGVVYLARDTRLRRDVALKVFPRSAAFPLMRLRMRREAEALSRIDDRGICSIYEFGETPREAFIAMRHVPGRTLAEVIRDDAERLAEGSPSEGRARVRRAVRIIEEVARSIHKAHVIGIVHRDLKPGNVMIDDDDRPVVLDFGLARYDESAGPTLTQTGDVLGTPAYMPPEQISGHSNEADARCDVYALGVCLYECLTLRRPFAAPTREELLRKILSEEPPDPRSIEPHIPKAAATVVAVAMSKDLRRRYASALDLAEDLRRVQSDEPILARRPGIAERVVRYVRRHRLQSALGATVLVALALGAYLAFRWSDLRAGDERRRAAAVEDALEAALDSVASDAVVEASLARLDAAEKAAGPTVDVAVGRALSLVRIGKSNDALAVLDAWRVHENDAPALKWARWRVLQQIRSPEADAYRKTLGDPPDALSTLIAGLEARESMARMGPEFLKPEIDRVLRAILSAPAPRRAFHQLLVGLAAEGGDVQTALATAEAMIRLWPEAASSWTALGYACQRPDPARSIRCFRKAIELGAEPRAQGITVLLANAHSEAGDEEACARVYREALASPGGFSDRSRALAYYNMADSWYQLHDFAGSIEGNRRALELVVPETRVGAMVLCNLAQALAHAGSVDEALATLKRAHAIGSPLKGWDHKSGQWIEELELYIRLIARLDALEPGEELPPEDEAAIPDWAAAAGLAGRFATATRWFRRVHGPDATVSGSLSVRAGISFAIAAAVRGAEGEGGDAQTTDAAARVAMRDLAFGWMERELETLRGDLEAKKKTKARVYRALQRWSVSPSLAPLRDPARTSVLPPAQQDRLKALWKSWDDLVAQVRPVY